MIIYKYLNKYPLLSEEEEYACWEKKDYDKLVLHNLRLVPYLVFSKYRYYFKGDQEIIKDLINEGFIGLIKASHKFNPYRGRFTTIAHLYITREINHHIGSYTKDMIYLPAYKSKLQKNKIQDNEKDDKCK